MRVDLGIWDKLNRLVIFLLFVAGVLALGIWYLPLIKTNEQMRKQIERLGAEIQKQEDIGRQSRAAMNSLRDPRAVERLARESWGYAKPGETVIRFEERALSTSR